MSKRFKTNPKSKTPTQAAKSHARATPRAVPAQKEIVPDPQNTLDTPPAPVVTSGIEQPSQATTSTVISQESVMELVKDNKVRKGNGKSAVYHIEGLRGSVKISSTMFNGDGAPATLPIEWSALATPGVSRAAETKEQRKARLAALPKLTAAEKLIKLEKKVARARAKLASASAI